MASKNSKFTKDLYSTRRVEALSDGVFSIAMTLLVLDLSVSSIGDITTNQQLLSALNSELSTNFVSFIISFLLLGSMWAVHARQFDSIKYADRHLMTINNIRLLAVVLIPFTTSLAGRYPEIALATVLFPINFMILTIISSWQWNYATSKPELYDKKELPEKTIKYLKIRNKIFASIAFIVVILSLFIGSWAFLLFIPGSFITMKVATSKIKS